MGFSLGPIPSPYEDAAALPPYLRPPRISGMAMPGGVHLAISIYGTGPSWRLLMAGMALAAVMAVAAIPTYVTGWVIEQLTPLPVASVMMQTPVLTTPEVFAASDLLVNLLWLLSFLCILWLSPLAGYHAAEHMTVACIERFGEVIPEFVARMPRAHPRCGTNWLAGIIPLLVIGVPLWRVNPLVTVVVGMVGLYFRHYIGYFLQQYFTTKPPSESQLRAGIEAGRRVMLAWRNASSLRVAPLAAAWHRGFIQVLSGVIIGMSLVKLFYANLHVLLDW